MSRCRLPVGPDPITLELEPLEPRVLLDGAPQQAALQLFDALGAVFVENQGQWADAAVRYGYSADGVSVAMTDAGPVFGVSQSDETEATVFSASFVGANTVTPAGAVTSDTVFNYFVGDQSTWRPGVRGYQAVVYAGLYGGVDLQVSGQRGGLKYQFDVAPGADYRQILVSYSGIEGLSLAADGSLHVLTAAGDLVEGAPYIYQVVDGQEVGVDGRFVLIDATTYAFELTGPYDPSRELVIDPGYDWARYIGGSDFDYSAGIAVDSSGNALVAGYTLSTNFDNANNSAHGAIDTFVAKISPTDYSSLLWVTYLGGGADDQASGIAVDSSGNALVTGRTMSSDFAGHNNTYKGGGGDAFLAKVSSVGSLQWATYLGGSGADWGRGVGVDSSGYALLTGHTSSGNFAGANNSFKGLSDGFVAKVSSSGSQQWATYIGGSSNDWALAIAVDPSGNALVTGEVDSNNFVGTNNSYDIGMDAIVAKVSSSGSLQWATYLGGNGDDEGYGIAVDPSGNAFVTGYTTSTDLSGTNGGSQGIPDAFVAEVSSGGWLQWATYLGGSGSEWGNGIALDASGNSVVVGSTDSTDFAGGTNGASGGTDAFVARVSPNGKFRAAFCLGQSDDDGGYGIALDASGDAYVVGNSAVNYAVRKTDVFVAHVPMLPEVWRWTSGATTVIAYDAGLTGEIDPNDIQVKFGKGGSVSSIKIGGTGSMTELGIAISAATSVGSIKDGRKGAPGDLAFIASDAPIKAISLKSGMAGYNINDLTLGSYVLPGDVDGDGITTDSSAIYCVGAIGKLSFTGDVAGDIYIGGKDPKKGLAFGSLQSKTGGLNGDLLAMGAGGKLSLGGNFVSDAYIHGPLAGLQISNGSFAGQLHVMGGLGKLAVTGWFCSGSNIEVEGLLKSAKILACETDGGGDQFGIWANSFGKLGIGAWTLGPADMPFNQDDMWVAKMTI